MRSESNLERKGPGRPPKKDSLDSSTSLVNAIASPARPGPKKKGEKEGKEREEEGKEGEGKEREKEGKNLEVMYE